MAYMRQFRVPSGPPPPSSSCTIRAGILCWPCCTSHRASSLAGPLLSPTAFTVPNTSLRGDLGAACHSSAAAQTCQLIDSSLWRTDLAYRLWACRPSNCVASL